MLGGNLQWTGILSRGTLFSAACATETGDKHWPDGPQWPEYSIISCAKGDYITKNIIIIYMGYICVMRAFILINVQYINYGQIFCF